MTERLVVCICTYRRPEPLARLLRRIGESAAAAEDLVTTTVLVVDDDSMRSAESTVAQFSSNVEVHYEYSGSGNISTARNRAVAAGSRIGDWLAFVDDDCLPDIDWIRQLVVMQRETGVDCVSGRCIDEAPPGARAWLTDEPFLSGFPDDRDGDDIDMGFLKNTLISATFLRTASIRFDVELGRAGGEDVMFFHDCHAAGLRHKYSARATVREMVPAERSTLRYQLRHAFWYGNTEAITSVRSGRYSRIRMAAGGAKRVGTSSWRPIDRWWHRQPLQLRFATAQVLRGVGRVVGACGFRVRHR